MNLNKKVLSLALGLGLGLSVGYASAEEVYIPLISKGFQHQFWQAVKAGADQAGKDFNVKVTFEGPETEAMVDKQIDMLSAALSKKPNAIGFAALDSKAAIPLLKKAQAAKIPVITFDSAVDSDIPLSFAATDNKAASALATDKMAELIGKSGEVAVVVHDDHSRTGIDRRDGFVKRMKAYHDIKVVSVQYGGGDKAKSAEITAMSSRGSRIGRRGFHEPPSSTWIGTGRAASATEASIRWPSCSTTSAPSITSDDGSSAPSRAAAAHTAGTPGTTPKGTVPTSPFASSTSSARPARA